MDVKRKSAAVVRIMLRPVSRWMTIALVMGIAACAMPEAPTNEAAPEVAASEIVFHNGAILTMEDSQPLAGAILIHGDTIAAVGTEAEVLAQAGAAAGRIDLGGLTLAPGFIDTHNHRIAWSLVGGEYESPEAAIQAALEQGWTGLHELDVNEELFETLLRLDEGEQLRLRVAGYLGINSAGWEEPVGERFDDLEPAVYSPYLRISGAKIFMNRGGDRFLDQDELNLLLPRLHEEGWQIAIEAVESETHEMVLSALEKALAGEHNDAYRHRIEHAVAISDEQLSRLVDLGIVASIQLNIPTGLGDEFNVRRFVEQEPEGSVARWRDLVEAGVPVIGNSDYPAIDMEEIDGPPPGSPIRLLYRAARTTRPGGRPPQPWMLEQALTAGQAMRLMTINAAYATFEEDSRGSLAPGKLADLVILSANPLSLSAEELLEVEVLATIVGGEFEWCKPGYESLCRA
jgi:predicted amidohydrolase YtcJ